MSHPSAPGARGEPGGAGLGLPDAGFARAVPVPPLLPILKALAALPGENLLVLGVGLAAIPGEAFLGGEATPASGFRLLVGIACRGGHGEPLCPVEIVGRRVAANHSPPA